MSRSPADRAEANYKIWDAVNIVLVVISALAFAGLFAETLVAPNTRGFTELDAALLGSFVAGIAGVWYSGSKSNHWADQSRQLGF